MMTGPMGLVRAAQYRFGTHPPSQSLPIDGGGEGGGGRGVVFVGE